MKWAEDLDTCLVAGLGTDYVYKAAWLWWCLAGEYKIN